MDEPNRRELAEALRAMKETHGRDRAYSYNSLQKRIEKGLGIYSISSGQGVGLYFDPDTIPGKPDLPNVLAIIEELGGKIDDLPTHVATAIRDELRGLRDLLDRNAWSSRPV